MGSYHYRALRPSNPKALLERKAVHIPIIALACACLFVDLFPSNWIAQKVSTTFFFAQILAFPSLLGMVLLLCGIAAFIVCKVKSRSALAFTSCAVWSLTALSFLILPNGLSTSSRATSPEQAQRVLSVVTFNAAATLTPSGFRELISTYNPDVIVLPETSADDANRAIKAASYKGSVYSTPNAGFTSTYNGSIAPTSVVVSERLGPAKPTTGPATSFGTVAIEFERAGLPTIIGIHTAPPLPGLMKSWKEDLERVVEFGESYTKPILIAGDFNATLRHGALAFRSRLTDAQESCSSWQLGTWSSRLPEFLRTPIDHILMSPDLQALSCDTKRIGQSDHLALHAEIAVL